MKLSNIFEFPKSESQRIISMEGLRGLAVFLVFLPHFVSMLKPWIDPNSFSYAVFNQLFNIGHIGVDLFFVLSGYLIYGTLIVKERDFIPYIQRRIQRIYPTFLIVFCAYLVLSFLFPNESKLPLLLTDKIYYIFQNLIFMPGLFDIKPIMTVAWTLSYEFFYYLMIPVLIGIFSLRNWSRQNRILLFLIIALLVYTYYYFDTDFYKHGGLLRLMMFVSGILLFEAIEGNYFYKWKSFGLLALICLLFIIVVLDVYDWGSWYRSLAIFILFFLLCLDAFRTNSITSRVFSIKPIRYLGNMSYSYYLIHSLGLKALFMILNRMYPPQAQDSMIGWIIMPTFFALTLIPAIILFLMIEKPFSLTKAHVKRNE